jgi:small GTP-binding protein
LQRVLSPAQEHLLRQERSLLDDLRVQLARLEASEEDLELLKQSAQQLDELFLLVVVGEFNAGKTAFLNAMLGSRLLPEGVTPTTAHIHVLRYGADFHHVQHDADLVTVFLPVEWLQEVNLVDTPGTNAVIQRHQQITEHFIPRSDLVLFVTSADRPFSESERAFLERIRQWGKKVVIVVNKIDLIEPGADREEILGFVRGNARTLLGAEPTIFPVSARLALQAKQTAENGHNGTPDAALWEASLFAPLEEYVLATLDAAERLRLKLENPLGVAAHLTEKYNAVAQGRQQVLKGDFETLDLIDEQLAAYEGDMRRDFKYQASRVDNVLYEMAERGDKFFDETLRIGRVFDLVNGQKISQEFDRQVVGDTSRAVERHVHDTIDWLVDKEYRQWRDIVDFLNRRWSQHADRIVGQLGRDFENSRQALLASIGRETQHIVDSYDRAAEADKLGEEVRRSIVQTAAIEAGAVGLGALLVAVLHTTLLDVTGILSAGALAALGFYLLPYRRQQLKAQLRERISELRAKLHDVLQKEFDEEITGSLQRIREAMAPYTRFVRVERDKLSRIQADLGAAKNTIESLQAQVRRLGE